MGEQPNSATVYAYGFERLGFSRPTAGKIRVDDLDVKFLSYADERRLDEPDGVIVPSGLFEQFIPHRGYTRPSVEVQCDDDALLGRLREVANLLNNRKWICCLVREIIDTVPDGYATVECNQTDLVKILLNEMKVRRFRHASGSIAASKYDEFREYVGNWGVAKTILQPLRDSTDHRVLATIGSSPVGLEFDSHLFFLPFHSVRASIEELSALVTALVRGVRSYLQKRAVDLPDWVDEFQFDREKEIRVRRAEVMETALNLERERAKLREFKGVVVRSGDSLRDCVATILTEYFGMKVSVADVGKEDLSILGEDGSVAAVVEVKGTKGGVKREHINQVDSHRERRSLDSTVPGLLIINDFMEVEGVDERAGRSVAEENVVHASRMNTLIIRSVDLLRAMRQMEGSQERASALQKTFVAGGGLLRVAADGTLSVSKGAS